MADNNTGPFRLAIRAVRLRCPWCGGRPVFVSWSAMLPSCPVCGLRFERGERGYWLGAYFFNLIAMETVFVVWMAGFLIATWPSPPWLLFQLATAALLVGMAVAFFPLSKTLFLAFDLWVRPPEAADFDAPKEGARRLRRGER
jgi:uncharacterized protein (DUF983 family)